MKNQNENQSIFDEMSSIVDTYEEHYQKFIADTSSENYIQITLRAHLYIEHELRSLLSKNLKYPDLVVRERSKFADIMRLVFAMGLRHRDEMKAIEQINKVRNYYSHNLDYQLSESDINDLINSLSSRLKSKFIRINKDNKELIKVFQNVLFTIWTDLISDNIIPGHIKEYLGIENVNDIS